MEAAGKPEATSTGRLSWGLALTISGLQAIGETQGQVAFRQKLSCFLSKANYHHGKVFRLFQLQRGEVVVTRVDFDILGREDNCHQLGHRQPQVQTEQFLALEL